MQKPPVIAIIMATMLEAKPFITGYPLKRIDNHPFIIFNKSNIHLIISGIGKANAAMATFHSCQKLSPDIIINMGAAGAADLAIKLGEFLHISEIVEYDRPDFKTGAPFSYRPLILEGFKKASVATQDKPVLDPKTRNKIFKVADLVEMEAASVIQAANKFNIPCTFFKYVTDTPEHTNDKDIVKYIKEYRNPFYIYFTENILPKIINYFQFLK